MQIAMFAILALSVSLVPAVAMAQEAPTATSAHYQGWKHSGSMVILTTPDGANLPASAMAKNFPLLVRLNRDWFDFSQAKAGGEDLRFSSEKDETLAYQVDEWDAAAGTASIWVRVPQIVGNARQQIRVHWGKADAASESNGAAVFNESNGYVGVWHMGDTAKDETGTLESKDLNTTGTIGMVGKARHLAGQQGIFCGEKITTLPTGSASHSTEAWFRATVTNGDIVAWGNEQAQGKVVLRFGSPPHVDVDAYFSGGNVTGRSTLPMSTWTHVVHTYTNGEARIYVNGVLDGETKKGGPMAIKSPARMWIGGWYNHFNFVGDIDEVRISKVTRSADWVKLQYENQKPLQTLVGPIATPDTTFAVSPTTATVKEGTSAVFTAQAGGAQKIYWLLKRGTQETIVATDHLSYTFDAGRVTGDQSVTLVCKAVYANEVRTKDIAIAVTEDIQEPMFTLTAPASWDGRSLIEVVPQVSNLPAMQAKGAGELKIDWAISDIATIKDISAGKLLLKRAQNSGKMSVTATISNGGQSASQTVTVAVTEPASDPWVVRTPDKDEKPVDGQFYARDDTNEGTLHYNGTLSDEVDAVFLKAYADDKPYKTETTKLGAKKFYSFSVKLKAGLVKYKIKFGTVSRGKETVVQTVSNLVCGDAYIIEGQSNALATDTADKSPPKTNEWIRSYGPPEGNAKDNSANLWCLPVWKAQKSEKAELGWWGMELAKRLVESQKIPICIINGAVGGTRIDQHRRNEVDPTDLTTIYGRMLWRVQQAKLTHGIRGILWHQGESDQGTDGPTGGFGWEIYQDYFVDMSAGWKRDFPNLQNYYLFQIWPNSCSMAGERGGGDRIREVQRGLPRLYSHMSVMSTLGIKPGGGCHYPLIGWSEFARLIQPVIERDNYGRTVTAPITPPNLRRASYASAAKNAIILEFDQPIIWEDALTSQFYLDGEKEQIASGSVRGNTLTLKLKEASAAKKIAYIKETNWSQDKLVFGANGIAALTFCDVPIEVGSLAR